MNNSKRYSSRLHLPTSLLFFVGVSLFGSATTLILAFSSQQSTDNLIWRKPLIGSLFMLICIIGITVALMPQKCSGRAHSRQTQKPVIPTTNTTSIHKSFSRFEGHHPDCGRFTAHTVTSGKHVFCAACIGLLVGASIAIVGACVYFFAFLEIGNANYWTVAAGQVGTVIGLAQLKFKSYARSTANAVFVVGSFLTLAGIDSILRSFYADLYVLALIVFWLSTRISMSQWDHSRICQECNMPCELKER